MQNGAHNRLSIAQRAQWAHLRIYRGVAWAGIVLQPLDIAFQVYTGSLHGPLVLRWAVVAGLVVFLAATYASAWARQRVGPLALLFTLIPLASAVGDLFASQMGRMPVLAACVTMIAVSLVLHERRVVVVFLTIWATVLSAVSFLVPDPIVEPPIATVTFTAVAVLFGFAVSRFVYLRQQQHTADSLMEVLFEHAADGVLFGAGGWQPQRANQRAQDLLETDDIVRIRDLVRAAWEAAGDTNAHAADTNAEDRRICDVVTAKNNRFWADIAIRRIRQEGATLLVVRITDISVHMQVEAQMRAAKDAAEAALLVRDRFLANVSHEIRTPMNGVIAMTSLMLASPLSDQQHELLSAIRLSGETMLAIINEILDFSKLEADAVTLEQQPFDVEQAALEAIGIVAPVALGKQVEVVLDDSALQHAQFIGDVSRFRQVLLNLLSNAVKFTHQGAVVVTLDELNEAGSTSVRVAVQDTGIGIPAALQDKLFEPFIQADSTTTRRYGGTGLGLSICKMLVEKMGGRIGVQSSPAAGARFEFVLPLHAVAETKRSLVAADAHAARKQLAVCTASEPLRDACVRLAARAGFCTTVHATAADALAQPGADAVLLDLDTPGTASCLVGREVNVVPVLGLLALDNAGSPAASVDIALRKPLHPSELRNALTRIARGEARTFVTAQLPGAAALLPTPLPRPLPSVLLAEDNAINQLVGRRVLESLGIRADVAADGREVLQMLEQRNYDVVLMDLQMPELDGLAATRAIRTGASENQPYIIAMTANVLPSDRAACRDAGMDDFVGKPIRVADVHAALLLASRGRGASALQSVGP